MGATQQMQYVVVSLIKYRLENILPKWERDGEELVHVVRGFASSEN